MALTEAAALKMPAVSLAPVSTLVPRAADLVALRLVLTGESAVDWPSLWFTSRHEADAFLRLCEFDTDSPLDMARLREVQDEAVEYLVETHDYELPREVEQCPDVRELLLLASHAPKRIQHFACMVLRVMHTVQHIVGRELIYKTAISEAQLLDRLSAKVFAAIDHMRAAGVGVREFAASRKTRQSIITKLLAKRSNVATHIFDRLRFKVTVERVEDVVLAIIAMARELFPVNYVVPEQSQNGIVRFGDIVRATQLDPQVVAQHWGREVAPAENSLSPTPPNEFSGRSYRVVNFVADIPLRIDDIAPEAAPAIVFAQAEIQIVDVATQADNERGENAHAQYKQRQYVRVRRRLEGKGVE